MIGRPVVIVLLLFAPAVRCLPSGASIGHLPSCGRFITEGSASDEGYGRWVGMKLGLCLIRDCSICVGTLQQVLGPEPSSDSAERRKQYYSKVVIAVDEWLYRKPEHWTQRLQLDNVPMAMTRYFGTEFQGERWSGVKVQIGTRLLIAFYPDTLPDGALRRITRYGLVMSNEDMFASIRATLDYHVRYISDPDQIANVPALIHSSADGVFSAYVTSYLWRSGGPPHTDTSAFVVSEIVCEGGTPGTVLLWPRLVGMLLDADHPLSDAMRVQVMTRLVEASCSEKLELAGNPILVLIDLVAADATGIEPFLSPSSRRRLTENYKALVATGHLDRQVAFERAIATQRRFSTARIDCRRGTLSRSGTPSERHPLFPLGRP